MNRAAAEEVTALLQRSELALDAVARKLENEFSASYKGAGVSSTLPAARVLLHSCHSATPDMHAHAHAAEPAGAVQAHQEAGRVGEVAHATVASLPLAVCATTTNMCPPFPQMQTAAWPDGRLPIAHAAQAGASVAQMWSRSDSLPLVHGDGFCMRRR